MTAQEKLAGRISQGYHICVGLDTDINKIPEHLNNRKNPVLDFNNEIIRATADSAAAYKINFAFYEKDGLKGIENLLATIDMIPDDILIIGDAKRGDIGNTSKMYAEAVFNTFGCDAVTLHPYMGIDSVAPFIDFSDKISFVLVLTSNKSAADFEKLSLADGEKLFVEVLNKSNSWNVNNNVGIVFGATNPEELAVYSHHFNEMPVLLPGVGAQQGDLSKVLKIFRDQKKENFIINVSRGLIYAGKGEDFAEFSRNELNKYNNIVKSA